MYDETQPVIYRQEYSRENTAALCLMPAGVGRQVKQAMEEVQRLDTYLKRIVSVRTGQVTAPPRTP